MKLLAIYKHTEGGTPSYTGSLVVITGYNKDTVHKRALVDWILPTAPVSDTYKCVWLHNLEIIG